LFGGLGYAALFGLIAAALARRGPTVGAVTTAVTAVGKRSLSSYLAQSVIFTPLLCAWGLGLGAVLGSAGVAALAIGVWLATFVGAPSWSVATCEARRSGCCGGSRTDVLRTPDQLCGAAPSAPALSAF